MDVVRVCVHVVCVGVRERERERYPDKNFNSLIRISDSCS